MMIEGTQRQRRDHGQVGRTATRARIRTMMKRVVSDKLASKDDGRPMPD